MPNKMTLFQALSPAFCCALLVVAGGCSGEAKPNVSGSLESFEKFTTPAEGPTTISPPMGEDPPSEAASSPQGPATPKEFVPGEEHKAFAREWVRVHKQNDTLGAYSLMDWPKFYERAFTGLALADAQKEMFVQELKRKLQAGMGIQRDIAGTVEKGGDFRLLGFREKGEKQFALFRILLPKFREVNYQQVELVRGADGKIRATEISTFRLDPPYSDEIRAMLFDSLTLAGHPDVGTDKRQLLAYIQLRDFVRQNHPREAIALYRRLPNEIQKSRRCAIWYVLACGQTSPELYIAAMDEFQRLFPQDASLPLMQLESATLRRDSAAQEKAIHQLRTVVWDDPFLSAYLAFVLLENGKLEEARREAGSAFDREPTLRVAHWARAAVLAKTQQYDELVQLLDEYARQFSARLDFNDWLALPVFETFRQSNPYHDWKERMAGNRVKAP